MKINKIFPGCRYQYNVPNRTCPEGTHIDKQCDLKESAWSDRDRSSCSPCKKKDMAPGYRNVPCSGRSTADDSGREACPNLPGGT